MEFLEHLDTQIFLFCNGLHAPWLDLFFYTISKPLVSLPIYLLVIFLIFKKFPRKKAFIISIFLIASVGLSDFISVSCFKNVFLRYRPSHNLQLENIIHFVHGYKGGMYGFVSSHAANTFAIACFSSLIFKSKWFSYSIFTWAAIVSFSRIYLGVHYPADIFVGALLGICIAFSSYKLYMYLHRK
jgi:undecaprenyl-diphosphatase